MIDRRDFLRLLGVAAVASVAARVAIVDSSDGTTPKVRVASDDAAAAPEYGRAVIEIDGVPYSLLEVVEQNDCISITSWDDEFQRFEAPRSEPKRISVVVDGHHVSPDLPGDRPCDCVVRFGGEVERIEFKAWVRSWRRINRSVRDVGPTDGSVAHRTAVDLSISGEGVTYVAA